MKMIQDQGRGSTRHTEPWEDLVRETAGVRYHRKASVAGWLVSKRGDDELDNSGGSKKIMCTRKRADKKQRVKKRKEKCIQRYSEDMGCAECKTGRRRERKKKRLTRGA